MRAFYFRLILLVAALAVTTSFLRDGLTQSATREASAPMPLNLNKVIERNLTGGERHQYQLVIGEGWYIHLEVEQRGVDVVLLFYAPGGGQLLQIDTPNGANGRESLDFIAAQAGEYRLMITAFDGSAKAGSYRVRLTELRKAKPGDAAKILQQQTLMTATAKENQANELIQKGQSAQAEPLLREGAALRRGVPGQPYLSRPLQLLALAYEAQGKNEPALRAYEEALPYLERDTGKGSAVVGFTLFKIGRFYLSQNNLAQAEPKMRRALEILDGADAVKPDDLMIAHQTMAILHRLQKRFSAAEPHYRRAIDLATKARGVSENADSAFLHKELGEMHMEQKDFARAAEIFQKALDICDRIKPHSKLTEDILAGLFGAKYSLSLIARAQNDFDQAEGKIREVLELLKRMPEDIRKNNEEKWFLESHALLLNALGEVYVARNDEKRKDPTLAEESFRDALALCEKASPEHPVLASILTNLGALLYGRKDYATAESLLQRALDHHRAVKSPELESFKPRYLLGQLYLKLGNMIQAEPHLLESYRLASQNPQTTAEIANHLGTLFTATGDFTQAESYFQQVIKYQEKVNPNSLAVAAAYSSLAKMYQAKGSFALAESYFTRAVTICRKEIPDKGKLTPSHIALLYHLSELGGHYIKSGNYERAEQLILEVRAIAEQGKAEKLPIDYSMSIFAGHYQFRGRFARAEALLQESLSYVEPESVQAALLLDQLGSLYTWKADYGRAEDYLKRALGIRERLDKDSPDLATSLRFLAELYRQQGRYSLAMLQADRILSIYEKKYGPNHIEVAEKLGFAAMMYMVGNEYGRAEAFARRRMELVEKQFGPEHPEVAESLESLCLLYGIKGDFAGLRPLRERAVAIFEKHQRTKPLNAFHAGTLAGLYMFSFNDDELNKAVRLLEESVARDEREGGIFQVRIMTLILLAQAYGLLGDFTKAEQNYEASLAMARQTTGNVSLDVIQPLKQFADFLVGKGDYVQAEKYYENALSVQTELYGPTHPGVADLLTSMGDLDKNRGDYVKPLDKYLKALEIRKRLFGAVSAQVIESQIKLADLYRDRGEYSRAEQLYQETLASAEKLGWSSSLPVFNLYFGLGVLYRNREEYDKAEIYFRKAQTVVETIYGQMSLFAWSTLIIPARMHLQNGEYAKAQSLLNKALAARTSAGSTNDLSDSFLRLNLSETYRLQGAYAEAVSLADESLKIREKFLGREHPETNLALEALSDARQAQGDLPEAVRLRALSAERTEKNITYLLTSGSVHQKSQFLATFNKSTDAIVSLHLRDFPRDAEAKRLALTTILRRKGRALDVFSDQLASLRERATPEDQALLKRLSEVSTHWTNLVSRNAAQAEATPQSGTLRNFEREISQLEEEIQQLEASLSARSAEFRSQTQTVTIDAVRAALPAGTALVEFITYRPYNPTAIGHKKKYGPARYAAYVLTRDSTEPGCVELGEAQPLDELTLEWRSLLGKRSNERQVKRAGNVLYKRLFARLTELLGEHRRLLIVPDGNLNLVQFAALVDEDGRYLIENYDISYLTSGRELLRLREPFSSEGVAMVIADPAFDLTQATTTCPPGGDSYPLFGFFAQRCYMRLPGTAQEAIELGQLLPGAEVWTDAKATEAKLKGARRPLLLHIATHGYFYPDPTSANSVKEAALGSADASKRMTFQLNPMVRSGLIMAGVKQSSSGAGEDGVLTAQEVSGLNLLGTKLVVLSACETGLGDAQNGQGVYGLRRALVLAGSETQVMSLWKVSDLGTRDFMVNYYMRLQAGEGRTGALRQVQLAMLRGELVPAKSSRSERRETSDTGGSLSPKDYRHPYYWAAFIVSGDWRSISGKEVHHKK